MIDQTIYAETNVTHRNKVGKLKTLLKKSQFFDLLHEHGKNSLIVIKANFTPASQKNYLYYTDPGIVNALTAILKNEGYKRVYIVESETNFGDAFPMMKPPRQGKILGFQGKIINLTVEKKKRFSFEDGTISLSTMMIEASENGFLINVPKAKNHEVFNMTCCLKNMYGSIPAQNKFVLFHKKRSGLSVPQAAHFANLKTPPHFHVVDFIDGVDGDERALFYKPVEEVDELTYYPAHMLLAGQDGLAIDKFVSIKMGYDQDESPIVKYHAEEIGNFDVHDVKIIGSNFRKLSGWRKVSPLWLAKGKFLDLLPIDDKLIAKGIRNYYFDTVPTDENDENI